ncbi:MAG: hypothetical protein ACJ76S_08645 [Solirubrobacteraceae bacterium]
MTLLNASGLIKVDLTCDEPAVDVRFTPQGVGAIHLWTHITSSAGSSLQYTETDQPVVKILPKPAEHLEWSVSRGSKVYSGDVYTAGSGASGTGANCHYTSVVF